ncbi:MAG: hypothetical protein WCH43_07230, partial [Verrucomicrobiota bacterium]
MIKSARFFTAACSAFLLFLMIGLQPHASAQGNFTWNGLGVDNNWGTGANWVGGTAPSNPQNILNFAGATRTSSTNNLSAYGAGFQIYFNSGAGAFTLSGNAINFYNFGATGPLIENDSTNLQTLSFSQIDVENNMTLYANTGNLSFSSTFYLDASSTLTTNASAGKTVTFTGSINNGTASVGKLNITGAGTTILSTASAFTGGVTLNSGTLGIFAGNNLG